MNNTAARYPYLVVRLMAAIYQREEIAVHAGAAKSQIGFRDSFVHHPNPFGEDGAASQGCKELLLAATLEAVRRTGHRMCLVWAANDRTFVERDGSINPGSEPPSGGLGTGGVGGTPLSLDIEFDQWQSSGQVGTWLHARK